MASSSSKDSYETVDGISFYSPKHPISPGTPVNPKANVPTLFKPITIRGATLKNRIIVAPMCQFSCANFGPSIGALTPYHIATLGHYALKGAGVVFIEASGVQPNGRISPQCPGIWSDSQIPGIINVAEMIHSQGALVALQLAHAGRKSSTAASFIYLGKGKTSLRANAADGGWPENVVGPSGGEDLTWDGKRSDDPAGGFYAPRELSETEIQELVQDWASAAARAVRAGVDILEIHGAHGYLIHEFLSPVTNRRQDRYGGSFENRTRLLIEIIQAVRKVIPASMPLFLRLSATEWLEGTAIGKKYGSWDVESTIKLAKIVADLGVDLLDVSSGGNHPAQKANLFGKLDSGRTDYQTNIAADIRKELRAAGKTMLIGAVGLITEADQARSLVESGEADLGQEAEAAKRMTDSTSGREAAADVILVARQFMREPEWVLRVAWKLGVDVAWPTQSLRTRFPKL